MATEKEKEALAGFLGFLFGRLGAMSFTRFVLLIVAALVAVGMTVSVLAQLWWVVLCLAGGWLFFRQLGRRRVTL